MLQQVRLSKTQEINHALSFLQRKYPLMSEAEIIKMALSEKYYKEIEDSMGKEYHLKKAYEHLMAEGKKLGDAFLKKRGLKREDVSEEEFYNLLKQKNA